LRNAFLVLYTVFFGFMAAALAVTAATAYYVSNVPAITEAFKKQPMILLGLFVLQLLFVIVLSLFINRLPAFLAIILFFAYAVSLGFTLSLIFLVYTAISIYSTFFSDSSYVWSYGALWLFYPG